MGGALWGSYDEREAASSFQDAIREWRTGGGAPGAPRSTPNDAALAPSDPLWKPSALQCCWECLQKFTHRGHYSSLAQKQFCSRRCAETYEKSRRLKRAPPAPPKRKVACQRCFNLCDPDAAVPTGAARDAFYCTEACAGDARGPRVKVTPGDDSAAEARVESTSGGPHGGGGLTMRSGAQVGGGRDGRRCPECGGLVDILRGAVGVIAVGMGRALCCSRTCADAVLARPTPEEEGGPSASKMSAGESSNKENENVEEL